MDLSDDTAGGEQHAILPSTVQTYSAINRAKDGEGDLEPRQYECFFGQKTAMPLGLGRHKRQGGNIAIPHIFCEQTGDKFL
jgi:hypothetical protein